MEKELREISYLQKKETNIHPIESKENHKNIISLAACLAL